MPVYEDLAQCFVCGGQTPPHESLVLFSRKGKSSKGEERPYYPFLEFHEPAPGAESMADDGSIQSCIVCFNFLHQQWLHFCKSRTAINKRLYWLKRPAGCEIRQPVNIIELEEILSEQAREEGYNTNSDEDNPPSPEPPKVEKTVAKDDVSSVKETVCFLCSIPTARSHMQKIALEKNQETIKTIPETPVFTVLSRHKPPRGAIMESSHVTLVCQNCFTDLCRKYPPEEQIQESSDVMAQSDRKINFKVKLQIAYSNVVTFPDRL